MQRFKNDNNNHTIQLWRAIVRSKAESCCSTSIHVRHLYKELEQYISNTTTSCQNMAQHAVCDTPFFHTEELLFIKFHALDFSTLLLTQEIFCAHLALPKWQSCRTKRAQRRRRESGGDDHLMGQLRGSQELLAWWISGLRGGAIRIASCFHTSLNGKKMRDVYEQKQHGNFSAVVSCPDGPGWTLHSMGGHVFLLVARLFSRGQLASVGEPVMKRLLIYLKQHKWEVVFHPLHHLSCHNGRKASFEVQSRGRRNRRGPLWAH